MDIIKTAIDGVVIIEPRLFKDERGFPKKNLKKKYVKPYLYKIMKVNLRMVYFVGCIFKSLLLHKVSWYV